MKKTYICLKSKLCHTALRSGEGALRTMDLILSLDGGPQRAVGLPARPDPIPNRNSLAKRKLTIRKSN